ncbi:MAG: antibiotic biosynthesis monooxygenase [Ponticaulis sp.]|nr:antibiotic biosynthesis monooxygenase [Ponticaulis sp.]
MIIVEGHVRLPNAEAIKDLLPAATAQIAASKTEGACLDYTYAIDVLDPCLVRVLEKWDSWEGLEAHFRKPHMTPWREALASVKFEERSLRAHDVGETRDV